jgi:ABC-2 type transport system ATP-binding protein
MGVLPETANVYVDLTGEQNLDLFGKLYGLGQDTINKRAAELLEKMGIIRAKDRLAKTYSKGMKQRLSLAMTLMTEGEILFLDEPTSGLDAESARDIRSIVAEMAARGKTIVLTTHNMHEAQDLCTRVAVINRGKIAAIDSPTNLRRTFEERQSVVMELSGPLPLIQVQSIESVTEAAVTGSLIRCYTTRPGDVLTDIVQLARGSGLRVLSAHTESATLEDVFLELVKGDDRIE